MNLVYVLKDNIHKLTHLIHTHTHTHTHTHINKHTHTHTHTHTHHSLFDVCNYLHAFIQLRLMLLLWAITSSSWGFSDKDPFTRLFFKTIINCKKHISQQPNMMAQNQMLGCCATITCIDLVIYHHQQQHFLNHMQSHFLLCCQG